MLQCSRLQVSFGETVALDTVDLEVPDGEVVAVMGPSGCGKTTLLRAVAGLQRLDAGAITWDGRDLSVVPPHERGFGFMFQDYALFPHLSVGGNVAFGLRMQGVDGPRREERVRTVLETVGLDGYEHRPIHELSGGEQQRVALARTLAPSPRLILLDEPIGALDRALREHLTAEMHSIFAKLEVTALYVTHDRDEAFAMADTVVVMDEGRVVRRGTPRDLWTAPGHEFVARMLGFGAAHAAVVSNGWAEFGWGATEAALPDGEQLVVIPPQAVRIVADGPLRGIVAKSTFASGKYTVEFDVGNATLTAISSHQFKPGDPISFRIEPDQVVAVER